MTLKLKTVEKIIYRLLKGKDYRIEIVSLLDANFLDYVLEFFERVIKAKLKSEQITTDWYKKELLSLDLPTSEIIINSGLNKKTISNMYNSAKREIAIDASYKHYEELYSLINHLIDDGNSIDVSLSIKLGNVSVELNLNESLIVINTLAVKRSAIRGGLWSTAGKQVEKPLMIVLCNLFEVPTDNYSRNSIVDSLREVDFYLIDNDKNQYRCEVKLMGQGNPESADVIHARTTNIFIGDKLSELNKQQFDENNVQWVELRNKDSLKKFKEVLSNLSIPHKNIDIDDINDDYIQRVVSELFFSI